MQARYMGELSREYRWGGSSADLAFPSPPPALCPDSLFVRVGSASCLEESVEYGTCPEGNELSVPARNLAPASACVLPGEESAVINEVLTWCCWSPGDHGHCWHGPPSHQGGAGIYGIRTRQRCAVLQTPRCWGGQGGPSAPSEAWAQLCVELLRAGKHGVTAALQKGPEVGLSPE